MAQYTPKYFAMLFSVLPLFSPGFCLTNAHIDFTEYVTHKLKDCDNVLYEMDIADINALSSISSKPIIVMTKKLHTLYSDNTKKPTCVTVFIEFRNLDIKKINNMLKIIRYASVIVFTEEGNELDLTSNSKNSYILVQEQDNGKRQHHISSALAAKMTVNFTAGNLQLSTTCLSSTRSLQTMLWLKDSGQILVPDIDFLTVQNPCIATLKNRAVHVSAFPTTPFVSCLPNGKCSGSEIDLLNMMANKIGYNYVVIQEKSYGSFDQTNGWSGVIGSVHNGTSQFGIGNIPIKLYGNVPSLTTDFSPELNNEGYVLLIPKPKPLQPFLNFVKPFSYWVWLLLIVTTFACIVATYALNLVSVAETFSWWQVSLDIIGAAVGQNIKYTLTKPLSGVLAIVISTWIIAMFFKDAAYYCNLRSFIVKKDFEKEIDTEEDLVNRNIDCYIPANSATYDDYRFSKIPVQQKIFARAVERKTFFQFKDGMSLEDERRMVQDGGARLVVKLKVSLLLAQMEEHFGYEPYKAGKNELRKKDAVGFLLPTFQPWSEEVNRILLRLVDAGIVEHLIRKYSPINKYSYDHSARDHKDQLEPYRIEHIAGSLILLSVGLFLAIILACFEQVLQMPLLDIVVHVE